MDVATCILALAGVNIAGLAIALWRMKPWPGAVDDTPRPPVSIVRPVRGIEPYLDETLRSSFRLAYPEYELIFCVADPTDHVIPLVHRLMAEHPQVQTRLLIGDVPASANPKLNNCVRGWNEAQHDWIVLADSNVLMPADYLQQLQAAWRGDTGLVCSTPVGSAPGSFWAVVECAFLNTLQARWQYTGEAIGFGFAQGKSMLWHRPFLEAHGGITALAAEIAEDAAATKLVRRAGRRVHLVDAPFAQPLGPRSFIDVWSRQARWARLRRVTFPLFFAPEILTSAILPLLVALMALAIGDMNLASWCLGAVLVWYAGEWALAARMGWHRNGAFLFALLVRDALIPLVWLSAWLQATTVWRGNRMEIEVKRAELISDGAT